MTVLILALAFSSLPHEAHTVLEEANTAYYAGDYALAIEQYDQLRTRFGVNSAPLFFNMGNAWRRKGDLGRAIYYYEAALAVDGRYDPARRNLQTALQETQRNLPVPPATAVQEQGFLRHYPLSPWQGVLATHFVLLLASLLFGIRYWRETTRLKWLSRLLPVVALLLFSFAVADNYFSEPPPKRAVTLQDETPVFFSMSELDSPRFLLYEGDRVLIDRLEGDWMRVHVHGGERGWARRDNLAVVDFAGI